MKKKYLLCLFIFFVCCLNAQNWQLIWQDDFNGSTLDSSKWVHDYGTGSQFGMWGWGNGELQYYQPQNTSVANGIAVIEVKEEPSGIVDTWNNISYYSSSKITTRGLFDFRYGKVEARIKTIDGQGFWPAFWLLPLAGSWPCDGEIDIMEQWGNNYLTNSTTGAAHIGTCPFSPATHFYQNFSSYLSTGSYADDFHDYSIIWKEDTITWYVDNIEMFRITPESYFSIPNQHEWPFNSNNWFIMINLAITQVGPNTNTIFPNNIQIDYVKVYQQINTSLSHNPSYSEFQIKNNLLNFHHDINSATIYDLNGRNVLFQNRPTSICLNKLNRGMYIVETSNFNETKNYHKIIIK